MSICDSDYSGYREKFQNRIDDIQAERKDVKEIRDALNTYDDTLQTKEDYFQLIFDSFDPLEESGFPFEPQKELLDGILFAGSNRCQSPLFSFQDNSDQLIKPIIQGSTDVSNIGSLTEVYFTENVEQVKNTTHLIKRLETIESIDKKIQFITDKLRLLNPKYSEDFTQFVRDIKNNFNSQQCYGYLEGLRTLLFYKVISESVKEMGKKIDTPSGYNRDALKYFICGDKEPDVFILNEIDRIHTFYGDILGDFAKYDKADNPKAYRTQFHRIILFFYWIFEQRERLGP